MERQDLEFSDIEAVVTLEALLNEFREMEQEIENGETREQFMQRQINVRSAIEKVTDFVAISML